MKKYGLLIAKIGYCTVVVGLLTGAGLLGSQRLREQGIGGAPVEAAGDAPGRTAQFQELRDVEPSPAHAKAMVFVTGAVKSPGLYEIPLGARAIEAIAAAGGATDKADLERVNLAQKLPDGTHLTVPEGTGTRPRADLHLPKVGETRASDGPSKNAVRTDPAGTVHEVVADDEVAYL